MSEECTVVADIFRFIRANQHLSASSIYKQLRQWYTADQIRQATINLKGRL